MVAWASHTAIHSAPSRSINWLSGADNRQAAPRPGKIVRALQSRAGGPIARVVDAVDSRQARLQRGPAARIGWFFGQKLLAARLSRPVAAAGAAARSADARQPPHPRRSAQPSRAGLAQHRSGYYARPGDRLGTPFEAVRRAIDFFADLSAVERRRHAADAGNRFLAEACRRPSPLLPAELSLSERRLSERRLGRALRPSGRGAVWRRRRRYAATGAGPAQSRSRPAAPRRGSSTSVAAPAGFCAMSKRIIRDFDVTGLDLSPHYLAVARRELQAVVARRDLSREPRRRCPLPTGEFDAHLHLSVSRIAAAVRRAVVGEISPRAETGWRADLCRFAADRRRTRLRRDARAISRSGFTSLISRAIWPRTSIA